MSKTLSEIAQQIKDANRKVQLIYAFNGTGKTRLSREFKQLMSPKAEGEEASSSELAAKRILSHVLVYFGQALQFRTIQLVKWFSWQGQVWDHRL